MIIFDIDTCNLCFNEPYKDFPASLIPPLNLIFSFFFTLPFCVVPPLNSSFKSFNVKKSENGCDLKFLLSFSGMTLLISKFVLVSWLVPSVICVPTNLSLNVSTPLAASLGTLYLTLAIILLCYLNLRFHQYLFFLHELHIMYH